LCHHYALNVLRMLIITFWNCTRMPVVCNTYVAPCRSQLNSSNHPPESEWLILKGCRSNPCPWLCRCSPCPRLW